MDLNLVVEHRFRAAPEAVFALALDPQRFPATFTGFGPIPEIRRIRVDGPPVLRGRRELENSDGTRLVEVITAYDPPRQHTYSLSGLQPPLAWLVRAGHADWHFLIDGPGTRVRWRYRFVLSHPLALPLAAPLLWLFMRTAMRRCLKAMALALDVEAAH